VTSLQMIENILLGSATRLSIAHDFKQGVTLYRQSFEKGSEKREGVGSVASAPFHR